jgi:hypothetical protein
VYGITNVTVNKQTNTYVSVLSPIINPIASCATSDAITTHTALAATSDTVNDYVYFLQYVGLFRLVDQGVGADSSY